MPLVSVILTSFNHEKYIREAIDSVLQQTFKDFELIIWDDASEDNSWEIINSYLDDRVLKFRNSTIKRGVYGINKAITEVASGKYIAIHHSDDAWEHDKLDKQVAFLEMNTEVGAVFTNVLAINEESLPLEDDAHIYSNIFSQENKSRHEWLNYFFKKGNALCHPSVMVRKKCYEDSGLYRYGFAQLGDFDMWVRLCLKHNIYIMSEKLTHFRVRANEANTSGNTIEMRSRLYFEYYLIIKNYLKITSFSELVLVFPGAIKYKSDCGESVEFVWSMILIDEGEFALSKFLALELLFNIINNSVTSKLVFEAYGFSLINFVDLTKKYGMANIYVADYEAVISERDDVIKKLDAAIRERDGAIRERDEIMNSGSWRITRRLRFMCKWVNEKNVNAEQ